MNKGEDSSLVTDPPAEPPPIEATIVKTIEVQSTSFNSVLEELESSNCYLANLRKTNSRLNIEKNDEEARLNLKALEFKNKFFPDVSIQDWNNWRWQIKNSITDYNRLESVFGVTVKDRELIEQKLPLRITPYYASVVYNSKELTKTVFPSVNELECSKGESIDPLHEENDSPVKCLVHRYPDRVLFLVTNFCSTNCRYCTRSRIVGNKNFDKKHLQEWDLAFEYIKNNPDIRDVIISGGDPLTLPDILLNYLLSNLAAIPHVEIIRIGTKVPVVLPMRINKQLIKILKSVKPLYFSIHFTHPEELTHEVIHVCNMLADAGIVLGSQTVLLKDINDDPAVMKKLFQGLLKIRVKPYYLYQCDPIVGSSHFRTPVEKGIDIIENLRGWTSGYAIPHYVIDAPGGGGKIPLLPNYYLGKDEEGNIILRNYEKNQYLYYDQIY